MSEKENKEEVSTREMWASSKRELGMRERVYPGWIDKKKMDARTAERELRIQKAIVAHFARLLDEEEGGLDLGI